MAKVERQLTIMAVGDCQSCCQVKVQSNGTPTRPIEAPRISQEIGMTWCSLAVLLRETARTIPATMVMKLKVKAIPPLIFSTSVIQKFQRRRMGIAITVAVSVED